MDRSAPLAQFSCHYCGDEIRSGRSLFFMHDKVFCSSSCRLSTAGNSRDDPPVVKTSFFRGSRKPTCYEGMDAGLGPGRGETASPDALKQQESAVRGASFFAYVSRLLSSDTLF